MDKDHVVSSHDDRHGLQSEPDEGFLEVLMSVSDSEKDARSSVFPYASDTDQKTTEDARKAIEGELEKIQHRHDHDEALLTMIKVRKIFIVCTLPD